MLYRQGAGFSFTFMRTRCALQTLCTSSAKIHTHIGVTVKSIFALSHCGHVTVHILLLYKMLSTSSAIQRQLHHRWHASFCHCLPLMGFAPSLQVQSQDCKKTATGLDQDCKRLDLQSWSFSFEIRRPQKDWLWWTSLVGWDRPFVPL